MSETDNNLRTDDPAASPLLDEILERLSPEKDAARDLSEAMRAEMTVMWRPELDEAFAEAVLERFIVTWFRPTPVEEAAFRCVGRTVGRRLFHDPAGRSRLENLWTAYGGRS